MTPLPLDRVSGDASDAEVDVMVEAARADYVSVLDHAVDMRAALARVYAVHGQQRPRHGVSLIGFLLLLQVSRPGRFPG